MADWIIVNFSFDQPLGMVIYVFLIIGFTYFYTFVQINPVQLADQMKKNGGYIPGIRPGKNTPSTYQNYEPHHFGRGALPGCRLHFAGLFHHCGRPAAIGADWWHLFVDCGGGCPGDDEDH